MSIASQRNPLTGEKELINISAGDTFYRIGGEAANRYASPDPVVVNPPSSFVSGVSSFPTPLPQQNSFSVPPPSSINVGGPQSQTVEKAPDVNLPFTTNISNVNEAESSVSEGMNAVQDSIQNITNIGNQDPLLRASRFRDDRSTSEAEQQNTRALDLLEQGATEGFEVDRQMRNRALQEADLSGSANILAQSQRAAADPFMTEGAKQAQMSELNRQQGIARSKLSSDLTIAAQERAFNALNSLVDASLNRATLDEQQYQADINNAFKQINQELSAAVSAGEITVRDAANRISLFNTAVNERIANADRMMQAQIGLARNEIEKEKLELDRDKFNDIAIGTATSLLYTQITDLQNQGKDVFDNQIARSQYEIMMSLYGHEVDWSDEDDQEAWRNHIENTPAYSERSIREAKESIGYDQMDQEEQKQWDLWFNDAQTIAATGVQMNVDEETGTIVFSDVDGNEISRYEATTVENDGVETIEYEPAATLPPLTDMTPDAITEKQLDQMGESDLRDYIFQHDLNIPNSDNMDAQELRGAILNGISTNISFGDDGDAFAVKVEDTPFGDIEIPSIDPATDLTNLANRDAIEGFEQLNKIFPDGEDPEYSFFGNKSSTLDDFENFVRNNDTFSMNDLEPVSSGGDFDQNLRAIIELSNNNLLKMSYKEEGGVLVRRTDSEIESIKNRMLEEKQNYDDAYDMTINAIIEEPQVYAGSITLLDNSMQRTIRNSLEQNDSVNSFSPAYETNTDKTDSLELKSMPDEGELFNFDGQTWYLKEKKEKGLYGKNATIYTLETFPGGHEQKFATAEIGFTLDEGTYYLGGAYATRHNCFCYYNGGNSVTPIFIDNKNVADLNVVYGYD